jgi:hypothetical protein
MGWVRRDRDERGRTGAALAGQGARGGKASERTQERSEPEPDQKKSRGERKEARDIRRCASACAPASSSFAQESNIALACLALCWPKPTPEIVLTSFRRATATGCESLQAQPSGGTSKSPQLLVQIVVLGDIRGTSEPQSTRIII